ncbi:MAG: hypothetical protein CMM07_18355 [Rhodopirellula sp.]|nr:hypothetical protein [Rhodopirellula sp.]
MDRSLFGIARSPNQHGGNPASRITATKKTLVIPLCIDVTIQNICLLSISIQLDSSRASNEFIAANKLPTPSRRVNKMAQMGVQSLLRTAEHRKLLHAPQ